MLTFKEGDVRPYLNVNIGGSEITGLLDSGANRTIIGDKTRRMLELLGHRIRSSNITQATTADGSKCSIGGAVDVPIEVSGRTIVMEVLYLPHTTVSLILGADFQRLFGIMLDLSRGRWYFSDQLHFKEPIDCTIASCATGGFQSNSQAICAREHLTTEQKEQLSELTNKYYPQMTTKYGCTSLVEHRIDTGDAAPVKQRYYPVSPNVQRHIDKELDEMLQHDIIEPSTSAWSSPVVLVRKPDNTYRFCVDYRRLNALTKKDAYPIPYVNQILNQLRDARYLSSIDIKSAYWQIKIAEESREKTAFTIPGRGLFQFKRMPFGLTNAPATWQRLIDQILGPKLEPSVFVFLDDIIIVTSTFPEHVKVLSEVFERLISAGLTINKEKTQLCRSELKYLGYKVNFRGLHVDPDKVSALENIPSPTSKKAVRSFIGATSWYRRFIPDYATKIAPLTKLLHKNTVFKWSEEAEQSFQKIKQLLIDAPILSCPKFDLPFELHCDASDEGIGCVLTQNYEDGEHVISYASRTLNRAEKHYSTTEKECLAVIWGIEHYRSYLEGAKFTVYTDHHSLIWLANLKDPRGRLARWAVRLQAFNFELKHRKGKDNAVADLLSRTATKEAQEEEIDLALIEVKQGVKDGWFQAVYDNVLNHPENYPSWQIKGNTLYKYIRPRQPEIDHRFEWKLVVPKDYREQVYRECHDDPKSGHLGFYKTYHRILQLYYWPKMKFDIANYVRRCTICQAAKPEQKRPAGMMGENRSVSQPFEIIAADVIGPLPRTPRGFKYILVVTDLFSKYTLLFPLRSLSSKLIAEHLEERVFLIYGSPRALISDNGPEFIGKETRNLCASYGIKMFFNARRHAQANPTERYNRTIITMIRSYVGDYHHKWDECLPKLGFALRTAKSEVTGYTPASLVFGREITRMENIDGNCNSGIGQDVSPYRSHNSKLKKIYEDVEKRLALAHIRSARQYNLRRRNMEFYEGDHVWKRNFVQSSKEKNVISKFAPAFVGPYKISRKVSPLIYELEDNVGRMVGRWHIEDLKPYTSSNAELIPD